MKMVLLSVLAVTLCQASCAVSSARITYSDRNRDGRIDGEYHAFPGRDRNWELSDTDFNGRYDKKISYGFAREESAVDQPVP